MAPELTADGQAEAASPVEVSAEGQFRELATALEQTIEGLRPLGWPEGRFEATPALKPSDLLPDYRLHRRLAPAPALARLICSIAESAQVAGRQDITIALWTLAQALDDHCLPALLGLAQDHAENGRHEEALATAAKAREAVPGSPHPGLLTGRHHLQRGEIAEDEALALAQAGAGRHAMMQELRMTQSWPAPLGQLIREGWEALQRGYHPAAVTLFRKALAQEPNIPEAHLGLALASRPGPDYLDWLAWLHQTLAPACYLEIGIETGQSLRLARPPTRAIGIDPAPQVGDVPFAAATEIISLTSQDFLTDTFRTAALVGGVDFAFIDGDHRFPAVLADFLELERLMAPGGVIALHDVWPLDELTAAPERASGFYAGDGWKLLPCLRAVRPDLDILTIATAPTGLALVSGFGARSSLLRDRYPDLCSAFGNLPYATLARDPDRLLGLIGNDGPARAHIADWLSAIRERASSSAHGGKV